MNNKVSILLLAICLSLTGLSLYQFNLIRSLKNTIKSEQLLMSEDSFLETTQLSSNQNSSEIQAQVDNFKEKVALLEEKLKNKSLSLVSNDEQNAENIKIDQKALELGAKQIERAKERFKSQYSAMLKKLDLPEEEEKILENLLIESILSRRSQFSREERRNQQKALNEEIVNLLNNPESYELYKSFNLNGREAYFSVKSLEEDLLKDNLSTLTPEQKYQLTLAEVKSRDRFNFEEYDPYQSEIQQGLSIDERVEYEVKRQIRASTAFQEHRRKILEKKIEQAREILSPEQYNKYQDSQNYELRHLNRRTFIDTPKNRERIRMRIERESK